MKVNDSKLEVAHGAVDGATGEKLEPEEQPAARKFSATPDIGMSSHEAGGAAIGRVNVPGTMETTITYQKTASELAQEEWKKCANCSNWSRDAAQRYVAHLKRSMRKEDVMQLNKLRGLVAVGTGHELAEKYDDMHGTGFELDRVISSTGICQALTEIYREPTMTWPDSGCPEHAGPNGEDLTQLFVDKAKHGKSPGSDAYDRIMAAASGKAS